MSLTVPNFLSALRIALIPFFTIFLMDGRPGMALAVFTFAGFTDLLDDFIARVYQQQSVLGTYLDPMADKLLITVAYVLLAIPRFNGWMPIPWLVSVLVITRDVLIVCVALAIYLQLGYSKFEPSRISKWNTLLQIMAIYLVLTSAFWPALGPFTLWFLYLMVAMTAISGLEYGYRFIYRAEDLVQAESEEI